MPQTETDLFNLAAQTVGGRGGLQSTFQTSRYNDTLGIWYPIVRPMVLAAAHWPSATKSASLALHRKRGTGSWTDADPTPGALFAYHAPADMIHPRNLASYGQFSLGMIADTKCIFAHEPSAILTYTFDQTNVSRWEPQLFLAMAHALGAFTAMTLTGKPSRVQYLEGKANELIREMRNQMLDGENVPVVSAASWHQARGYTPHPGVARYVYPAAPLLMVGGSAGVK